VAGGGNVSGNPGASQPSLLVLFASSLKAGLLTFGGAYTAIPLLREDAVGGGWMTNGQFLDGLALSGALPAPLIIFSTFVGYVAGGVPGALLMTLGIFLPAFSFSLVIGDRLEAVVENEKLHTVLEGVVGGVVGIIVATALELGATVVDQVPSLPAAIVIFVGALALLYLWQAKVNVVFAMVGSGIAGWLLLR
jgi:chromate transporter